MLNPVKINYRKFIEENFQVSDKDTLIPIPFKLNKVQAKYSEILSGEYPEMEGVREIILKARQEGMSSYVLALFATDFLLRPYSVSICISHRKDATDILFKKVKSYIDSYFRVLAKKNNIDSDSIAKQFLKSDNRNLLENATNGAVFYIGTAGAKVGGRGGTARNILFCLSGNSLVMRHDTSFTQIKNLKKGDTIVDGNGYLIKVNNLSTQPAKNKQFKSIKIFGSSETVSATDNHMFLVHSQNGPIWKSVKDITINDYMAFPLRKIRNTKKFFRAKNKKGTKTTKELIPYNYDFGRFVGWYLAEGCASVTTKQRTSSTITLSVHHDEVAQVMKICEVIRPLVTSVNVKKRTDSKTAVISIYGKSFRWAFTKKFGTSHTKKIPYDVYKMGREFLRGLVLGYVEGDGYITKNDIRICGIRQNLIYGWSRIIKELGFGVSAIYTTKEGVRNGRNEKQQWNAVLMGTAAEKFKDDFRLDKRTSRYVPKKIEAQQRIQKWFLQGFGHKDYKKYAFQKVLSIDNAPKEIMMYDVVLDKEPHSFITSIGVSHNSETAFYQDTDLITAQEIVVGTAQQVPQGRGMIFIESTANGVGNYYQETWEKAMRGESTYKPRFFGWKEFYTQEWVEEKRKEFPNDRMWRQEYPADADEAFVVSGSPYFNTELLKKALNEHHIPIRQGKFAADGTLDSF
jgi:hypothetical protein